MKTSEICEKANPWPTSARGLVRRRSWSEKARDHRARHLVATAITTAPAGGGLVVSFAAPPPLMSGGSFFSKRYDHFQLHDCDAVRDLAYHDEVQPHVDFCRTLPFTFHLSSPCGSLSGTYTPHALRSTYGGPLTITDVEDPANPLSSQRNAMRKALAQHLGMREQVLSTALFGDAAERLMVAGIAKANTAATPTDIARAKACLWHLNSLTLGALVELLARSGCSPLRRALSLVAHRLVTVDTSAPLAYGTMLLVERVPCRAPDRRR